MGIDLAHRRSAGRQPPRIVVGFEVAHQRRHPRSPRAQLPQSALQGNAVLPVPGLETRFSTSTPAASKRSRSPAPARRSSSEFLAATPQSGWSCLTCSASSISIDSISSSRPWRRSLAGSPQCGQRKLCTLSISPSAPQAAQCTITGTIFTTSREPSSGVSFGGNPIAELQRVFDHRSQRAHLQPHLVHARAGICGSSDSITVLHNARNDGKLMHDQTCCSKARFYARAAGRDVPNLTRRLEHQPNVRWRAKDLPRAQTAAPHSPSIPPPFRSSPHPAVAPGPQRTCPRRHAVGNPRHDHGMRPHRRHQPGPGRLRHPGARAGRGSGHPAPSATATTSTPASTASRACARPSPPSSSATTASPTTPKPKSW